MRSPHRRLAKFTGFLVALFSQRCQRSARSAPLLHRVRAAKSHCDVIAVRVQWMASFLFSRSITVEGMSLAIWIRTITYVERLPIRLVAQLSRWTIVWRPNTNFRLRSTMLRQLYAG